MSTKTTRKTGKSKEKKATAISDPQDNPTTEEVTTVANEGAEEAPNNPNDANTNPVADANAAGGGGDGGNDPNPGADDGANDDGNGGGGNGGLGGGGDGGQPEGDGDPDPERHNDDDDDEPIEVRFMTPMIQAFIRLGFNRKAAYALYYDQGLTSVSEVMELDEEQVVQTCKNVRKPGHMIPNPCFNGRNNQPPEIYAPGYYAVSPRAEMNFKLALYWFNYRNNTTRITTPDDITTLEAVQSVKQLKEWEDKHKKPDLIEKVVHPHDWNKTFDIISDHIRLHIEEWDTVQLELENRAPINDIVKGGYHANFAIDNQKVWDILAAMLTETECYTYAKPYRTKKDGRGAYKALFTHYLGKNSCDDLAAKAENALKQLSYYSGEKRGWSWEKYVCKHVELHQILEGLVKYGHNALNEQSKVRHLQAGIKTRELDPAVRTQVLSTPSLRKNFEATTGLPSMPDTSTYQKSRPNVMSKGSNTELDSHADTCIVGSNVLVVADHGKPVSVTSYDTNAGPKTYRTVDAAVAYDDPTTGKPKIVMVNQAIHIPHIHHNLLCPMQARLNDVIVNDIPKFLVNQPNEQTHAITLPATGDGDGYTIPLSLRGVTSYFPTRKPTLEEYNAEFGNDLELTYDAPEWDPSCSSFSKREDAMTDWEGHIRTRQHHKENQIFALTTQRLTQGDMEAGQQDNVSYFHDIFEPKAVSSVQQVNVRPGKPDISPEELATRWGIGIESAKATLKKTTQRGTRSVLHPSLSRRYKTNDRHLRYRRLPVDLYCDTMKSSVKSRRGNTSYAQVYCARNGWKRVYPMKQKSEAHHTLADLFTTSGVPATMISDGSKEQTMGDFRKLCRESHCHVQTTEPHSPWSNVAEQAIKELKLGVTRKMRKMAAPLRLWDDCLELEALIQSHTASRLYGNQGEAPETMMFGETADISQLCEIGFYDWVMYRDSIMTFPDSKLVLGRYLGPSIGIGPAMMAKILKANREVVHRSTYRALTPEELKSSEEKQLRDEFDASIKTSKKLGPTCDATNSFVPDDDTKADTEPITWELYEDDNGECHRHASEEEVTPEEGDVYIAAEVLLPIGSEQLLGKVKRRKRGPDGEVRGKAHDNPILDTRTYEVEFPDGQLAEYSANTLAENMWSMCDMEGKQYNLLDEVVDHKMNKDVAVKPSNMWITVNGRKHAIKSTRGWSLCIQWKDGSQSWETLADVKESFPLEVAQYAEARQLLEEPAFHWWAPQTLKRSKRIVVAVNTRYQKTTHKFGIKVPKTVAQAQALDRENGNTLWMDAIKLELANVRVAFKILEEDEEVPQGYQQLDGHFVFTIKMESFKHKARWVAGASSVETAHSLTYASVVSRESVRIALTLAALNDLQVVASDIQNAYLTAPTSERIWTVLGPEWWGPDGGKKAIIVRALYGLKSSGASFRNHLADCMRMLQFRPCLADPDVWLKEETHEEDGHKYYAYDVLL